jgi:hypothetical protein
MCIAMSVRFEVVIHRTKACFPFSLRQAAGAMGGDASQSGSSGTRRVRTVACLAPTPRVGDATVGCFRSLNLWWPRAYILFWSPLALELIVPAGRGL